MIALSEQLTRFLKSTMEPNDTVNELSADIPDDGIALIILPSEVPVTIGLGRASYATSIILAGKNFIELRNRTRKVLDLLENPGDKELDISKEYRPGKGNFKYEPNGNIIVAKLGSFDIISHTYVPSDEINYIQSVIECNTIIHQPED